MLQMTGQGRTAGEGEACYGERAVSHERAPGGRRWRAPPHGMVAAHWRVHCGCSGYHASDVAPLVSFRSFRRSSWSYHCYFAHSPGSIAGSAGWRSAQRYIGSPARKSFGTERLADQGLADDRPQGDFGSNVAVDAFRRRVNWVSLDTPVRRALSTGLLSRGNAAGAGRLLPRGPSQRIPSAQGYLVPVLIHARVAGVSGYGSGGQVRYES
jgi:hypothetical protein